MPRSVTAHHAFQGVAFVGQFAQTELDHIADGHQRDHLVVFRATRYLDLPADTEEAATPEGVVRTVQADGFLQDITTVDHHLQADEPVAVGGTNLGMTPYQLLAAGLGACTSMTLKMYADRKGIDLTGVTVNVTHTKSHKADAEAEADARADVLTRVISLDGDLTDDVRNRLLEIADKCPVHRTLEAGARIETSLD